MCPWIGARLPERRLHAREDLGGVGLEGGTQRGDRHEEDARVPHVMPVAQHRRGGRLVGLFHEALERYCRSRHRIAGQFQIAVSGFRPV